MERIRIGEGSTPGPWTIDEVWSLIMADNNKVEVAAIHAGEAGNQRAHRNIAAANAELIRKAPLLIEAVAALELAKATIERLTVRHGPFSSTDGTVSVINSLLAKLDAE